MKSVKHALAAAALIAASASSYAGPITANQWYGFCFAAGAGNAATAGCQNDAAATSGNSFTFTLTTPGLLKVTDAFVFGDTFDVFVNGVLNFTTGGGTNSGVFSDPDLAFNSGSYDKGSVSLPIGIYSVDVFTRVTPGSSGGAYLQVLDNQPDGTVPNPGTLSLVGLGLLGLGMRRRAQG
jgi:PEP-CTERM motif